MDDIALAEACWLNTSAECLEKTGVDLDKGSFVAGFVAGKIAGLQEAREIFNEQK